MIYCLLLLLIAITIKASHFNGGTIRWVPLNPYSNSSSITITIIQSYTWSYSAVDCLTNVPISTSGYATRNANLTCIANCATDGNYSTHPINILTDCTSTSSALGVMSSQKSKNVTLSANAYFSLLFVGEGWVDLNDPPDSSLNWSLVVSIDFRKRPDGFINTPPVGSVFSPQYAIVNQTINISIHVSDVNTEDDIRCRWSVKSISPLIDECNGACYPGSMPNGTSLSNCILSFKGLKAGIWYAAALQVEDFINTTSLTPMSSVPVQFLIYVKPAPKCSLAPVFLHPTACLEATVGVSKSLKINVLDLCDYYIADIADIVITRSSSGMTLGTLYISAANDSVLYRTLTWTPQASQIGSEQLCVMAYTTEYVQSAEYCITFTVITSSTTCAPTTTTTSTTSTKTTSTTSTATTSTASTTTSSTTSTATSSTTTTTTSSTTTTTTSSSTTTTTSSTTSTTTSSTTSTTTSSTTTTRTSSTITTTTSSTTTTTTSSIASTATSSTTSTATIVITDAGTSTSAPGKGPSWGLIAGISSVALPLALCSCCCLYRLLWSPAARRRRRHEAEEEEAEAEDKDRWRYRNLISSTGSFQGTTSLPTNSNSQIEVPKKSYQVYDITTTENNLNMNCSPNEHGESILVTIYNNTNGRTQNPTQSLEKGHAWMKPMARNATSTDIPIARSAASLNSSACGERSFIVGSKSFSTNLTSNEQIAMRSFSTPPKPTLDIGQSPHLESSSANFQDWSRIYLFGSEHKTGIPRIQKPS